MDMKSKHVFIIFCKIYYPIWVNMNDHRLKYIRKFYFQILLNNGQ